jgi:hypothetical protein
MNLMDYTQTNRHGLHRYLYACETYASVDIFTHHMSIKYKNLVFFLIILAIFNEYQLIYQL